MVQKSPFAEWQSCHGANGIQEVSGSIPLISTRKIRKCIDIRAFADFFFVRCGAIILAGNFAKTMSIATLLQLGFTAHV